MSWSSSSSSFFGGFQRIPLKLAPNAKNMVGIKMMLNQGILESSAGIMRYISIDPVRNRGLMNLKTKSSLYSGVEIYDL